MMNKGKGKVSGIIALFMSFIMLIAVSPIISLAADETGLKCDVFGKKFTVEQEFEEKVEVVTNNNTPVSIQEIGFLENLSSKELLPKIASMKIEGAEGTYILKGKPVTAGEYHIKITGLPNGSDKPVSTVFKMVVDKAEISDKEYVTSENIKTSDDFKEYVEEAKKLNSNHIRVGKDIKTVSEVNIDSSINQIDGSVVENVGGKLYLTGATPRVIGIKENKEAGKIVFKKGAKIKVLGIHFDSENVDVVIEKGADVYFNRCSFAHTPTNYGTAYFRKSEFKTGKVADYGTATYEKTETPENIAKKETKPADVPSKPSKIEIKIGAKKIKAKFGDEIKTAKVDVPAFIENDKVMLPVRAVATMAGFDVVWDKKERKVTLKNGENIVVISLKTRMMYINNDETGIKINPVNKKRRTFLPIKELSRALMMKKSDFKITQVK